MRFFAIQLTHYDYEGWKIHLDAHLRYLQKLVERGTLRASGPLLGGHYRAGFLVMSGKDREEVVDALNHDPFIIHGLVNEMTMMEWDPVFGTFSAESSGKVKP